MRVKQTHTISNPKVFKQKLLHWGSGFQQAVWLDSNDYTQKHSAFDAVLAVEAERKLSTNYQNAFSKLKQFQNEVQDWLFGYLSYDLKNDVEALSSENHDGLHFPELYFFQPKKVFLLKGNTLEIHYLKSVAGEVESDLKNIEHTSETLRTEPHEPVKIKLRIHKDAYFEKVNQLLWHIHRGDVYEANFCQEFYAEDTQINPLETFVKLNAISKPPFATFMRLDDRYLLSASPERYLKKTSETVISQPIKGTAKRSKNKAEDLQLKNQLQTDEKERSENIMIVDLVRNDLSRTAKKGSVRVEELCKIYNFPQVHQMISTVTSKTDAHPVDVLKTTFPMGSMTGAPKVSAMQIIERLEATKRGLYSGAVGYFTPVGDFDFNVVIRSILYNAQNRYVSYSVGGAITAKSVPEKEYEECLVKAKAMRQALES